MRFPILSSVQRAHAGAADAEAVKARRQAEATKNQVSEETLKLQRAVRQLEAAQEVAQLEYEIAQSNVESVQTRIDSGNATIKDLGDARLQAGERYVALQDAIFELQRARVGLLRSTGELEKWINGSNWAASHRHRENYLIAIATKAHNLAAAVRKHPANTSYDARWLSLEALQTHFEAWLAPDVVSCTDRRSWSFLKVK